MAAEAIISKVLEELPLVIACEIEQEVRLVVGVRKEVETLTTKFLDVKAVLDDAEKRQLKEDGVRRWMYKLKVISYDIDDVVDEWSTAIGKSLIKGDDENAHGHCNHKKKVQHFLTCLSCFRCCREVCWRRDIAVRIKDLNGRFDAILNEQRLFKFSFRQMETSTQVFERPMTTSLSDVEKVKGREHEKGVIISKLLNESSQTPKLHIISIIGMGGIGKTTLASLAYNDSAVKAHFQERIWVCVSDPFDEVRVAKAILESLTRSAIDVVELQNIVQKIQQSLEGKKFLLVLDDVWEENPSKWDNLEQCLKLCGSTGSRLLVTTRKENAARAIGCNDVYRIGLLSEDNCWELFRQIAFFGWGDGEGQQFEEIGRKIVSKCKGLPLAVKTLGSLLRSKKSRTEWQSILESGVWELEIAEVAVFPHLWLSYRDLSPALRQCFLYCAIYPKDYRIVKYKLIESWMAHGYLRETQAKDMETLGEEHFETLAARSFFQEFEIEEWSGRIDTCKMHDIVHDFALYMTRNECFSIEVRGDSVEELGSASDSVCKEARHARIMLSSVKEDSPCSFPNPVYDVKKLRGLVIDSDQYSNVSVLNALPNLFNKLIYLRSLDLRECCVEEIPSTISQLIHLRRLDLSYNGELKELPEAVGELYNLETLDIRKCEKLEKLPHGIVKLHKLRHLHNYKDFVMGGLLPKGIERLSCLRALDMVDVGYEEEKDAFCLADFEKLNRLRGDLLIYGLRKVKNLIGAKQASLKNKSQITNLTLSFIGHHIYEGGEELEEALASDNEELLQVLEPPPNLEALIVAFYKGTSFSPSWMLSLTHLKDLQLNILNNCEKLPCLESIELKNFTNLKRAGVEFWGIEEDSLQTSSVPLFPKLRKLWFFNFESWEQWDDDEVTNTNVIIMPCLRSLIFKDCRQLKTLPQLLLRKKITPEAELKIFECPFLAKRYKKKTTCLSIFDFNFDWYKISHISCFEIDGE